MRRLALALTACAAVTLAACSSSPSSSSPASTAAPKATTTTASAAPGSGAGSSSAGIPAVAHATDLSVEPVISAGPAPAPGALVTKDLVVGTGATATASSTVVVQYVGTDYATGKVFDSSWQRGQPLSFSLSGVVPGFAQGIEGMKVGGRRQIVIPPALGYGAAGQPPVITPNETLVFVVDLKSVS